MNLPPTPAWLWLIREQDAAVSCLRRGWTGLADYRFAVNDAEPLLVLLATGTEKLLKLTFGLCRQEATGSWPSLAEMSPRKGWGHRIADLDAECRRLVRAGAQSANHPHQVTQALDALDADEYIGPWLTALQRYAQQGRFYNLDRLADPEAELAPSPLQLWDEVYGAALEADPSFGKLAPGDEDGWNAQRERVVSRLSSSLRLWWGMYHLAWVQGACGSEARQHSSAIAPPKH